MRGADLSGAHLRNTNLSGADLHGARLDSVRVIRQVIIDSRTRLDKVAWKNTPRLRDDSGKGPRAHAAAHRDASRVYREVGLAFRQQGLSAQATAYRLLELTAERKADYWEGHLSWLGSGVLNVLAGYGYRPGRTIIWYLAVVAGFAFMYLQATNGWVPFGLLPASSLPSLTWYEALILSVSAFHGRGFFQPLQSLGDPIAALAALEAVIGLLIEVTFIATFTQRFFGSR